MEDLLRTTAERAARYLIDLKDRGVAPTPAAIANLGRLDEAFPERPTDPSAVVALLDEIGSPATLGSAGGGLFGFVVRGGPPRGGGGKAAGAPRGPKTGGGGPSPPAPRPGEGAL